MSKDLMAPYRRLVQLRPMARQRTDGRGTWPRDCRCLTCKSTAEWRVGRKELCDKHGREEAEKLRRKASKRR